MTEGIAPIPDLPDEYEDAGAQQLRLDLGLPDEEGEEDGDLTLTDIAIAAGLFGLATGTLYWLGGMVYSRLRTA